MNSSKRVFKNYDSPYQGLDCDKNEPNNFYICQTKGEAVKMLETIQSIQNIQNLFLLEMETLAISAADSSKSLTSLKCLNAKFTLLKNEITRLAQQVKFNGLNLSSDATALIYDPLKHRLVYWENNARELQSIDINLAAGNRAANALPYCFENKNGRPAEFILVDQGRSLLYTAQATDKDCDIFAFKSLMKLDLQTNVLLSVNCTEIDTQEDSLFQTSFTVDDIGRVWLNYPSKSGKDFKLARLDVNSMKLDFGIGYNTEWSSADEDEIGEILIHPEFPHFTIYQNHAYFIAADQDDLTKLNLIEQNLTYSTDRKILQKDLKAKFGLTSSSKITFSPDGQFLAFVNPTHKNSMETAAIKLVAVDSGRVSYFTTPHKKSSITSLQFDRNNRLYCIDDFQNSLISIDIKSDLIESQPILKHNVFTDRSRATLYNCKFSRSTQDLAIDFLVKFEDSKLNPMRITRKDICLPNLELTKLHILYSYHWEEVLKSINEAQSKVQISRGYVTAYLNHLHFMSTLS